jgi:cellulose synthase/poly-beta-1,6-N-acetylglucosamine synthase-like glycosyltransferase
MRRAFVIALVLLFVLTWLTGARLPLFLAVILNGLVLIHFELATLRRLVLTAAALLGPPPPPPYPEQWPRLTALVPCRNEAAALPATLSAWDAVSYPRAQLELIFIDDGSVDETAALLALYALTRPWVRVQTKAGEAVGKGAALAAGLAAAGPSDGVVVFDADARPRPDCLEYLAAHLVEPGVAAVAGRMIPDAVDTPAAIYARVESAVHQRVTLTGAARLGATTPLLGSAYLVRRLVLDALGFDPTHRLEDIDLSMRLFARGYCIVFEPWAVCDHRPPASLAALAAQRTAWSRGFHRVAAEHWRAAMTHAGSALGALDRLLFALGYLDRASLALGVLLAILTVYVRPSVWMPWWVLVAFVAVPLAQAPLAMLLDGWGAGQMLKAIPALLLAAFDPLTELAALVADLFGRRPIWRSTPRAEPREDRHD